MGDSDSAMESTTAPPVITGREQGTKEEASKQEPGGEKDPEITGLSPEPQQAEMDGNRGKSSAVKHSNTPCDSGTQRRDSMDSQSKEPVCSLSREPADNQSKEPAGNQSKEPAGNQSKEPLADNQSKEPADSQSKEPLADNRTKEPADNQTKEPADSQSKEPLADNRSKESVDSQSDDTSMGAEGETGGGKTHITLTVDKAGQFHCSQCDVRAHAHAFEEHIVRHIMPRPYQCLYCSQCFVSRREVSGHVQREHTGRKMNCALRALKRVKGMMEAVLKSGKYQFCANVPGKVPLVRRSSSKAADKVKASKESRNSSSCAKSENRQQSTEKSVVSNITVSGSESSTAEMSSGEFALENLSNDSQEGDGSSQDVGNQDSDVSHVASENSQDNDASLPNISCGYSSQNSDDGIQNVGDDQLCKTDDSHADSSLKNEDYHKLENADGDEISAGVKNSKTEGEATNCASDSHSDESTAVSHDLETKNPDSGSKRLQSEQNDKPEDSLCSTDQNSDLASSADAVSSNVETADLEEKSSLEATDVVTEAESDTSRSNRLAAKHTEVTIFPSGWADAGSVVRSAGSSPSSEQLEGKNIRELSTEREQKATENETSNHDDGEVEKNVSETALDSVRIMADESMHSDAESSQTEDKEHPQAEQDGSEPGQETREFLQSNFHQGEENQNGTGLKIVAAFSLQEEEHSENPTSESEMSRREENKEVCSQRDSQQPDSDSLDSCSAKEVGSLENSQQPDDQNMDSCNAEDVCAQENPQQPDNQDLDSCSAEDVCSEKDSREPEAQSVDPCGASNMDDCPVEEEPTPAPELTQQAPPLTLGPPSKPVPSSSFLDLPPHSSPISSHGADGSHSVESSFHFFICGFDCGFSGLTPLEFRDHLVVDHPGEGVFRCHHCGYQSPSEDGLIRHISAHAHTYSKSVPLYICGASACKFGSNLVGDFVAHQSTWHPDLTIFYCHDCDASFGSVDDLLKHFDANFLHIINCPHCLAKTTDRRTLLLHISTVHPGKPKMVSVAKQIVCRDRKRNGFLAFMQQRYQTTLASPESEKIGMFDGEQKSDVEQTSTVSVNKNRCLLSILKEPILPEEQELTKKAAAAASSSCDNVELREEDNESFEDSLDEEEFGSEAQNGVAHTGRGDEKKDKLDFKCNFCTFVARDPSRLEGHERGHGLPASRKTRFKCMYCPQSFNNKEKFHSHVTCHPGLIRFNLYGCQRCDFDSNQKHIIVKHARSTHDRSCRSSEEDLYTVTDKSMESRVLECFGCSYMTRHRKHLVSHMKQEHSSSARQTGDNRGSRHSNQSSTEHSGSVARVGLNQDHPHGLSAQNDSGMIKENQTRRFKCPICQYLLPRAADLQAHVKRHSEIGEITLVMFRCKYCSSASTAREVVYGHLMEKHMGREVAIVKKIVKIDTNADDNGYAVRSVEDRQACETSKPATAEESENQVVLVIPDSAGEKLQSCVQCPKCAYSSSVRKSIIAHVCRIHPDVKVMGRRENTEVYPLNTLSEALKGEILIVPDNPTFEEAVLCPKCDYSTQFRRSMVQHLDENHPEVSVMGRNDYPSFEVKDQGGAMTGAAGGEGMVIIGSGSLDEKIRCLYENFGDGVKCLICQAYRPKKFFMHLHILRHLNILLWGCLYCSHRGLQKYKMIDHIKKVHPRRAYCVRYLPANVEEKVNHYLQTTSLIQSRRDDGQATTSCSNPRPDSFQDAVDSGSSDFRSNYKAAQDSLEGCIVGSDELDMKLACLYSVGNKGQSRCVVCAQEFRRKYAIHRHLVQTHLLVNLIGCGYCDVEGVERHVITDHILEAHKSAALSMRNLARNLQEKVTEFLCRMTLSAEAADDDVSRGSPEPPLLTPAVDTVADPDRTVSPSPSPSPAANSTNQKKNQLNPNLLLLGKDSLNKHLKCMFSVLPGPVMKFRCSVCQMVFDRKYAIHRHLLLKHLKVGIIGCPYCPFEGVERYQVFSHIKEEHRDCELRMCHLSVDLGPVVSECMQHVNNGTINPNSRVPPPWSMKKVVKKEAPEEEDEDNFQPSPSLGLGHSLVVAMFGGRRTGLQIKKEPVDEEEDGGQPPPPELSVNGEEQSDSVALENGGGEDIERVSRNSSCENKNKLATDVKTSIRVIPSKKNGLKRYTCEACAFTSPHRSNVARHIYRIHEHYRMQRCQACSYRTLSKIMMKQHMENIHPGQPYSERSLKRSLDTASENREHKFAKIGHPSTSVSTADPETTSLDNSESLPYTCADCSFETLIQSEIVEHVQKNHSPEKDGDNVDLEAPNASMEPDANAETEDTEFANLVHNVKMNPLDLSRGLEDCLFQCFYCSYKTSEEIDLKIHFSDAHPMNPFKWKRVPSFRFVCRSCHVKTKSASKMRYHLNRHINYRPYTCTTCGSYYPSPDQCRKHCQANNHSKTFTYIKVARKEARLRELLKESQEIANALMRKPEDLDTPDPSYSVPVLSRRRAKKSFPSSGIPAKMCRMDYDNSDFLEDVGGEEEDGRRRGEEEEERGEMGCSRCDFSAQSVFEVRTHFLGAHRDEEFRWLDSSTGHICKETGEITNAKDIPPDWDTPPDSGYMVTGSGLLSCRHCEFTTTTVQAMKSHVKRHLPKRYLCPYCSMRCSRRDTVTMHVRCAHKDWDLWTIFFQLSQESATGLVGSANNSADVPDNSADVPDNSADVPDNSVELQDNSGDSTDNSVDLAEPQVTFQVAEEEDDEEQDPQSPAALGSGSRASNSPSATERIGCGHCQTKMECVAEAYQHHGDTHPDLPFLWVDSSNGYSFNFLGEVVDAKRQTTNLFTKRKSMTDADGRPEPSFRCQLCPFRSAYIQAIKSHMKSHQPHGFICPYCSMTTSSKEKMVSHQSSVHKGQESWVMHLRMAETGASTSGSVSARERSKTSTLSPVS